MENFKNEQYYIDLVVSFVDNFFKENMRKEAFALCNMPFSILSNNETTILHDFAEFNHYCNQVNIPTIGISTIQNEKVLFLDSHHASIYLEINIPVTNVLLECFFSLAEEKIHTIHYSFANTKIESFKVVSPKKELTSLESNEMLVAALNQTGMIFWEYLPFYDQGTVDIINTSNQKQTFNNFTEMLIRFLNIAPSSQRDLINLHEAIIYGQAEASTNVKIINFDGEEEWRKIKYTVLQTENNFPVAIGTSENINELKQLEKRFSVATAQAGVSIWNYDLETRTLSLENNPEYNFFNETSFPNTPECFFEKKLVHDEDIENFRELFHRIGQGDSLVTGEIRFKNKDTNEYTWHQIAFSVALDSEGYPSSVIGTSINIDTQKKAEEQYIRELKLLEAEDSTTLLSFIYSFGEQKITRIKSKFATIKNSIKHISTLCGEIIKLCPRENHKKFIEETFNTEFFSELLLSSQDTHTMYITLKTNENESIWAKIELELMKNPTTFERYVKISVQDITREYVSDIYFKTITDQHFDSISRINYKTGKYIHYESEEIKKIIPKQALSDNFFADVDYAIKHFLLEEEREIYIKAIEIDNIINHCKNEEFYDIFYRIKRVNNSIRYKRSRFFMLDESTSTVCLGTADITEMHEIEKERSEMLRQSLLLAQQANKAKNAFLASMSHDIRTPMNAIIGMANLALEDRENQEQITESLSVIKSSSEHLLLLINDILEMSRLESGNLTLNKEPFSIITECANIANAFKGIVIQKQQEFIFKIENVRDEFIIGDTSCLKRILNNLLGNALKFTPKNGKIYFKLFQEETVKENQVSFRFEIQDTGIGISKELLPKIFEPFQREQSEAINNIEGTGLGLAIVKALIELQGGAIKIESEQGKGTLFIIHISYLKAQKKENISSVQSVKISDINLHNQKILLFEDHPVNTLIATKLLQKMGAEVISAQNGKIGVELFEKSHKDEYNFILMDIQMPVMNGYEATKAIRESTHPNAKTVPIIAMTANAFAEDIHKSLNSGMNDHIAKPISTESIKNTLEKLGIIS